MRVRPEHSWVAITLLSATLGGCAPDGQERYAPTFTDVSPDIQRTYSFGVHPLHNPQRLFSVFAPLMDYLSEHIDGCRFRLEASRNYPAYDDKLARRVHDFSLPNPYQTIQAIRVGYRVIAKMGDDENFRGIILVRRDSGIRKVADLSGKAVSYPAPTALAATMMPQFFLQSHGLNVLRDLDNRYVGSQESAIMNVYLGETAAASTWPPPWRALVAERPELDAALEVRWQTEPLINNGVVAHPDVPAEVTARVQALLTHLHESPRGRQILEPLELSRFEAADDATYARVQDFLQNFTESVRPL